MSRASRLQARDPFARSPTRESAAGSAELFSGANQGAQRLLGSVAQLTTEERLHKPTAPPGREMEVSIETDERAAGIGLCQRHVLTVDEAERQMHCKVDPAAIGIHVDDVDCHQPLTAVTTCREPDHLAVPHRPWRLGGDEACVLPFAKSLHRGEHVPHRVG